MGPKVLCVAEKPAIARAVADHLSGGQKNVRNTKNTYIKNYEFTFDFGGQWGQCSVVMTSVLGHLTSTEFPSQYRQWQLDSIRTLFECPIDTFVDTERKSIAENIEKEARYAQHLYIWTDCDREGEHIGWEIQTSAMKGNARIRVYRAQFSHTERGHVLQAARTPRQLDQRLVDAVSSRIEIDLRCGAAFTRLQTMQLRNASPALKEMMISYGPCQFPTLGFVVDRYFRVKTFKPEAFWHIRVRHARESRTANFSWLRGRLYDRFCATILYERCLRAKLAEVRSVDKKPTSHYKPLPLTTVELQKLGSRFLGLSSQNVMNIAEALYNKGFISYPRTETDQFDKNIDLRALVQRQTSSHIWGQYAHSLCDGGFCAPRNGRHNDKAHPPIHPIKHVDPAALETADHRRVYEFVTRRFLACCSDDARGATTTVTIQYGPEAFRATGLLVLARNFLEVYPYDRWRSSAELPHFDVGEKFEPAEAMLDEGSTTAPGYLTEPELIALMDANGIGTDATMAEHIAKIVDRQYVVARIGSGGRAHGGDPDTDEVEEQDDGPPARGRGGSRGRGRGGAARGRGATGRGRGRGGGAGAGGRGGTQEFIPSTLGVALVQGYDQMGFEGSLSKPFLRRETERRMRAICEGRETRADFLRDSVAMYRDAFVRTSGQIEVLRRSVRRYVDGQR